MTPELSKRVRDALETLTLLDPQQQAEELARLRQSDAAVATEVASLLHQANAPAAPLPKARSQSPTPPPAIPGCELSGEVKYGGMGAVYFGEDSALRRPVAVKVLREEFADDAEMVARFEAEAQVCAQLQHPGIVPVHQVGRLTDGRPFYVMKLVRGDTLGDLLKQRSSPSDHLSMFLGHFRQVCEAMAYAHAKGVLHRDLKPSNVMVGAYGEVLLMDWGLTKLMDEPAEEVPDPPSRRIQLEGNSGDRTLTALGAVLGTIPYMPPEQARGRIAEVDARSDVFGLGAILFTILTGQPPYVGPSDMLVLRQAMQGDLGDAHRRLAESAVDSELQALTRKCLASQKEDRPADAGVVAREIADYLARMEKRLHQAEVRAAEEQKRRLVERQKRRLAVGLAVALLLLVVGGGSVAWFLHQEQLERQTEDAKRKAEDAKRQVEAAERQAEEARKRSLADGAVTQALAETHRRFNQTWAAPLIDGGLFHEALAQTQKADELARTSEASEELKRQAADLLAQMRQQVEAADSDRKLLTALLEVRKPHEGPRYRRDDKGTTITLPEPSVEKQFQAAFHAWDVAFDVDSGDIKQLSARVQRCPQSVVRDIVAALDEWMLERRRAKPIGKWQRLADLAAALDDPDSGNADLRELLIAETPEQRQRLEKLAADMDAAHAPVLRLLMVTRALQDAGSYQLAEQRLRDALRSRPPGAQDVPLYQLMGRMLADDNHWIEAREWFAVARQQRPELGESLADALMQSSPLVPQSKVKEALALYAELTREQPDNPWLHVRYGIALARQEQYVKAEVEFRASIRLEPDSFDGHHNLGAVLQFEGHSKEAEQEIRQAIAIDSKYATAHCNLGNLLTRQNRYKEAEPELREAIRLRPTYAEAHQLLGYVLGNLKQFSEAEKEANEAIRLRPSDYRMYWTLGKILKDQGRPKEAEAAFRQALTHNPADSEPMVRDDLAGALWDQNRYPEAEAEFREVIRLQPNHPDAHRQLGLLLLEDRKQPKEAEPELRAAIRIQPNSVSVHVYLGRALQAQQLYKEAEVAYREALRIDRDYASAHFNLGVDLYLQKQAKDAEAEFRAAIRLQPDSAMYHRVFSSLLSEQKRYKEAEAECRAAIRLQPDDDRSHANLGFAVYNQKREAEAEAPFREVIRLKPDNFDGPYGLGLVLNYQRRYKEAESAFREALRLNPDSYRAHEMLGEVFAGPGRYKEAEAEYREAVRLKPDEARLHSDLGFALRNQGRFAEAQQAFRRAGELGSRDAADRVADCERFLGWERKLPAILQGGAKPTDAAEQLQWAALCRYKRLYTTATYLAADALDAKPKLDDDRLSSHRYNAACSALVAARGDGADAQRLPDKVQLMLRRQALDWLRADLAYFAQLAEREADTRRSLRQELRHWQHDPDLAGVRDAEALDRLPSDERPAWRQLWKDVADQLKKLAEKLDSPPPK